jgi:blue copper oxidase
VTAPDANLPMMGMGMMGAPRGAASGPQPVLAFEAGAGAGPSPALPSRLDPQVPWDAARAVRTRRFTLDMGMGMGMMGGRGMGGMRRGGSGMEMFSINGRPFDPRRVDERVRLGDLEIWEVAAQAMAHPFHIHGVHFRVLSRGSRPAAPDDAGTRDTVRVDQPVRLLVRFDQPALAAPFMYHCHILEHEDHGMMGQFTVA